MKWIDTILDRSRSLQLVFWVVAVAAVAGVSSFLLRLPEAATPPIAVLIVLGVLFGVYRLRDSEHFLMTLRTPGLRVTSRILAFSVVILSTLWVVFDSDDTLIITDEELPTTKNPSGLLEIRRGLGTVTRDGKSYRVNDDVLLRQGDIVKAPIEHAAKIYHLDGDIAEVAPDSSSEVTGAVIEENQGLLAKLGARHDGLRNWRMPEPRKFRDIDEVVLYSPQRTALLNPTIAWRGDSSESYDLAIRKSLSSGVIFQLSDISTPFIVDFGQLHSAIARSLSPGQYTMVITSQAGLPKEFEFVVLDDAERLEQVLSSEQKVRRAFQILTTPSHEDPPLSDGLAFLLELPDTEKMDPIVANMKLLYYERLGLYHEFETLRRQILLEFGMKRATRPIHEIALLHDVPTGGSPKLVKRVFGIQGSSDNRVTRNSAYMNQAWASPWFERLLDYSYKLNQSNWLASVIFKEFTHDMALLYDVMGDYERAEELYIESLQRLKSIGANGHVAMAQHNLGTLYHKIGQHLAAEDYFRKALETKRTTLDAGHRRIAYTEHNLAVLLHQTGLYEEAGRLYEASIRALEQKLGSESTDTVIAKGNLGLFFQTTFDHARARELLTSCVELNERKLGKDHPLTVSATKRLGLFYHDVGDIDMAEKLAISSTKSWYQHIEHILRFSSEKQRLAFIRSAKHPWDLTANLQKPMMTAEIVLRLKGAVLQSILSDRNILIDAKKHDSIAKLNELNDAKSKAINAILNGSNDQRSRAISDVETLERELADESRRFKDTREWLTVHPEDIRRRLPPHTALIDYFAFNRIEHSRQIPSYGALIYERDNDPRLVLLGERFKDDQRPGIDELVIEQVRLLKGQDNPVGSLRKNSRELYERLIAKLGLSPDITHLLICPDEYLYSLSFSTLPDKNGKLLLETCSVRYLNSARDALRKLPTLKSSRVVVFADPSNGKDVEPGEPDLFGSLPGTVDVARSIGEIYTEAEIYVGKDATEEKFRSVGSPRLLHLGTHGFAIGQRPLIPRSTDAKLEKDDFRSNDQSVMSYLTDWTSYSALYRSGIVLWGAETAWRRWERQKELPGEAQKDGIVLASEFALVRLDQTELVSLPACNTADGDIIRGEGVIGLRRALAQTGAHNYLLALWRIDDAATAAIMKDFYGHYASGAPPAQALTRAQRERTQRSNGPAEYHLLVREIGPFVLHASGLP